MRCENCGRVEASIQNPFVEEGKFGVRFLCAECASKLGVFPQLPLSPIFDTLMSILGKGPHKPRKAAMTCGACGLEYEKFRKTGMLGCGKCYESFRKPLLDALKRIHGGTRHAGKVPVSLLKAKPAKQRAVEMQRLKAQLKKAVADEMYEEAARLRDLIKGLGAG